MHQQMKTILRLMIHKRLNDNELSQVRPWRSDSVKIGYACPSMTGLSYLHAQPKCQKCAALQPLSRFACQTAASCMFAELGASYGHLNPPHLLEM